MLRPTENTIASTARRHGLDPAELEARLAQARRDQAAAVAELGRAVVNGFKGLFSGLGNSLRRRMAYEELYALDDRMLRDIGLNRGELWAAVEGRVERGPSNDNRKVEAKVAAGPAANENAPKHRAA
jgi:uncharacterized protein YjiS (DUF1127 family)